MKQAPKDRASSRSKRPHPEQGPAILTTGSLSRDFHLLLAHGAGAPMTSPFLETLSQLLNARGVTVHRFEFDYMASRRQGGTRRPPPRAETLTTAYTDAITACRRQLPKTAWLFIGGKSMGGRVACLAARNLSPADQICGVVILGYPLHPPRRPENSRAAALLALCLPALIIQGTRDALGSRKEFARLDLPASIGIHWIEDGDHDLAPRRSSGRTHDQALAHTAHAIAEYMRCTADGVRDRRRS